MPRSQPRSINAAPLLPAPADLGLPDKFTSWRPGQQEAILRALDSPKRFVVLGMPTGFGKSLTYMAAAVLDEPTAILTSTKGLQSQLKYDFEDAGLTDIRGMSNYPCLEANNVLFPSSDRPVACDEGPCLAGWQCPQASSGCLYFDQRRLAQRSHVVVTNYAYWMAVNASSKWDSAGDGKRESGPPLNQRGRLVLDEAHAAIDELGDHLAIEIGYWEVENVLGTGWPNIETMAEWREWARTLSRAAGEKLLELGRGARAGGDRRTLSRLRELRDLTRRLGAIAGGQGQWILEQSRDRRGRRVVRFDPVWPGEYAEASLFLNTGHVILTSATIRPKTLELLGVSSENYEFVEYASNFSSHRRPFIWVPTVRVRHDMAPGHARQWVAKIDAIIRARPGRKGIVHTVSYARRDFLLRYSEHANRLVTHAPGQVSDTVERFKHMRNESGAVLVSPSVGTGFDFPDDDCRFQIVGKVPFPDSRSKILQARQERDPEYFAYVAAQNIVQMAGRGVRSADDWCETIIVDDNWQWFYNKFKKFMPKWFTMACSKSTMVPEPLHID
jgi:ATP-dependent DNA helicase DinG